MKYFCQICIYDELPFIGSPCCDGIRPWQRLQRKAEDGESKWILPLVYNKILGRRAEKQLIGPCINNHCLDWRAKFSSMTEPEVPGGGLGQGDGWTSGQDQTKKEGKDFPLPIAPSVTLPALVEHWDAVSPAISTSGFIAAWQLHHCNVITGSVAICCPLDCNPIHIVLGVNLIEFNGTYF